MAQNVGVGTTNPQAKLSVGTNSEFRVDSVGDIARINNVPYAFPTTQGANGKTLVNDGSGNFAWKEAGVPVGSIVFCNATDTTSLLAKGFLINGLSEVSIRYRSSTVGTWTPYANTINLTVAGSYYMQANPTVWDGTEMLSYNYFNQCIYKWNPSGTTVTISAANTVAGFTATYGSSAVWDGTEMIIYGGALSNKGVKYNPSSNAWSAIADGPTKTYGQSAAWDGPDNVMIVWGGDSLNGPGFTKYGYKYNPTSNTWSAAISLTGAPSARGYAGAVWTGTKMLIFGGNSASGGTSFPLNDCYAYTPGTNTWATLASAPSYAMSNPQCVWTGTDMLVWGSYVSSVSGNTYNTGYDYNVASNIWNNLPNQGAVGNNTDNSDVAWDGTEMLVVRGNGAQKFTLTGSDYYIQGPSTVNYYIMQRYTGN